MGEAPRGAEVPCSDSHHILQFGPFAFETSKNRLYRDGVEVHLTPKAAAVLLVLLQRRGELITKDEFLETVWPDVHVREESLTQAISVIRQALGDSSQDPEFIQTVSGEGYRFIGEVSMRSVSSAEQDSPPAGSPAEEGRTRSTRRVTSTRPGDKSAIRRLSREALAAAAVVVVAIGILAWLWRPAPTSSIPAPDFATVTSYPGYENYPTLSPDGRQVAFMWNEGEGPGVYVQFVSGGEPLRIADARYGDPAWRPDGERIAYMRDYQPPPGDDVPAGLEVRTVTPYGTEDTRVTVTLTTVTGLDWSHDGRFLALSDRARPGERPNIFLVSAETGQRHQVTFHGDGEPTRDTSPSFSPDGRHLAFIRERIGTGGGGYIYVQRIDDDGNPDGPARLLQGPEEFFLNDVDWAPDGRAVVYSGGYSDDYRYLTMVPIDGGEPMRLAVCERGRDFSIVGNRLVCSQRQVNVDIWRIGGPTAAKPGEPERWANSTHDDHFPHYGPDGRATFISGRSGTWEVWVAEADGSKPRKLTDLGHATRPRWAPDGSLIAFNSGTPHRTDIYTVDPDGGLLRRLNDHDEFHDAIPGWSRDSGWIYFQSLRGTERPWAIWRMSRDGGDLSQITRGGDLRPLHHGGRVYWSRRNRIVSLPEDGSELDGAEVEELVDYRIENDAWDLWRGKLVFIEPGDAPETAAIKIVDLDTGNMRTHAVVPKGGTDFIRPEGTLAVSPDGHFILYSARSGPGGADLILVDNFR